MRRNNTALEETSEGANERQHQADQIPSCRRRRGRNWRPLCGMRPPPKGHRRHGFRAGRGAGRDRGRPDNLSEQPATTRTNGIRRSLGGGGRQDRRGSEYYRADGTVVGSMLTTDSSGWNGIYGMHRADLLNVLAASLPPGTIRTGHLCIGFEQDCRRGTVEIRERRNCRSRHRHRRRRHTLGIAKIRRRTKPRYKHGGGDLRRILAHHLCELCIEFAAFTPRNSRSSRWCARSSAGLAAVLVARFRFYDVSLQYRVDAVGGDDDIGFGSFAVGEFQSAVAQLCSNPMQRWPVRMVLDGRLAASAFSKSALCMP